MSKFAVLKVEGLTDSEEEERETSAKANNAAKAKAKAKNQSPAKDQQSDKKAKKKRKKKAVSESQDADFWKEWVRRDEEQSQCQFQQDLEAALLASKVETDAGGDVEKLKRAARADTAALLSKEKRAALREQDAEIERQVQLRLQAVLADKDAAIAERDDVIAEKDAAIVAKEAELADARAACQKLRDETERLEAIIRLVEGKKGAGLCQQVSELEQVIAEITEHMKIIDSDLAKERTRSHQLQTQLDRLRPQ